VARRVASRFVAGEDSEKALDAVQGLNAGGLRATLDVLGENVTNREEAAAARDVYFRLLDEIHQRRLDCNVSVKLTQMGIDLSDDFCHQQMSDLAAHAAELGVFVRVDMEGSAYTERTIRMVCRLRRRFENVGAVLQAYLYRSEKDAAHLLGEGTRIRLCKGAYQEPPEVAFQRKADVDRNYIRLAQMLLDSGVFHGLATHDPAMIRAAQDYARQKGLAATAYEFQMLYGIRRDLQRDLRRQGFGMRVYVPFGSQWFPYLMRRLAERPANLSFFLSNVFRG
jgi:proline dehydrogenase